MANIARVRVEARRARNDSFSERERIFKALLQEFKKRVNEAGILHEIKEHQYYESPSEKNRKARKDSMRKREQEKMLEAIQRGENPKGVSKFLRIKKKKNTME